jgi:quinol monooxygenase YgiN
VDIIGKFLKDGVDATRQIAQTSRTDKGNLRFDLLTLNGRPNHVTIFEAWSGREAMNAHWAAAHTKAYRERYHPMSGSLYDERIYEVLAK